MILRCRACGAANRVPADRMRDLARCGRCKSEVSPPNVPVPIHSPADLDELLGAPLPLLIDFWAPWCGPCHAVAPHVERLAARRSGALVVAKIDTEELPDLAARYGIRSIPTMVLFDGGHEQHRIVGAMPAEAIEQGLRLF